MSSVRIPFKEATIKCEYNKYLFVVSINTSEEEIIALIENSTLKGFFSV